MPNPITVLVVDSHEIVRRGVRAYLDNQSDFQIIGEASSGEEALEMVSYHIPDLVLLDIKLPDWDGIEVTIRIKKISPLTQIVVLTSMPGDGYSFQALKAGAISYLLKDIKMDRLAEALRCAARGEATIHPQVATCILQYVRGEQSDNFSSLTRLSNREMDVLRLIAGGFTNHQIAKRLAISENTVKGHVCNIRSKLQIESRVHLAIFAWEKGIVQGEKIPMKQSLAT